MAVNFSLADRLIVVTGGTSGIGRDIALACSQAGARVALVGRSEERMAQVLSACPAGGLLRVVDLTDVDALPQAVGEIVAAAGPISGLVHSAGVHKPAPIRALRAKQLHESMTLNVYAAVMLLKGLAMKGNRAPTCSAVFVSSVLGHVGEAGVSAYAMSKGALELAAKSLALELWRDGIRVNCVAPATVRTPMSEEFLAKLGDEERKRVLDRHPGGFGTAQDVAGAVLYLLSDASRFVTGTSLRVDGGYCAR